MNLTFVATGLLLIAGVVLTWRALGGGARLRTAQVLLLLGSAGLTLAGTYPADVDENLHVLGAALLFGLGNAGLVLAGLAGRRVTVPTVRGLALGGGLIALAGTVLFFTQQAPVIGVGGMERFAAFPLPLWALAAGIVLARHSRPAR